MQITRKRLIDIVDRAINRGKPGLGSLPKEIKNFKIDQLQRVARDCHGVDFGNHYLKYGCPVAQADLIWAYGGWFIKHFDALMCAEFDIETHGLNLGWSVEVID